jgi:putative transposase
VVSDLLPRRSSGGRGREHLPAEVEAVIAEALRTRYLTRQRGSVASVHREIKRVCRSRGLRVPSRGTLERRIAELDPVAVMTAREGADAARPLRAAGGVAPPVEQLLEQVQIDHTVIDVMVVDERHRLPIGRPYMTAAIDVCSRCVVGLVVTLEAPSALSVGLCLVHMVTDKQTWLERLEVDAAWPMSGKPRELYLDKRRRVQERGAAAGLCPARHHADLSAPGATALRWGRGAGHRHDDDDGARAAGHDVLQPDPTRLL